LSGHSGGYQVIASILDHGGLTNTLKEVWLFDALYARTDKFLASWDKSHGRLIDIYTEHGGTREENGTIDGDPKASEVRRCRSQRLRSQSRKSP